MRVRSVVFRVYVVVSLLAIFALPAFVPVPVSASPSYLVGFNNRVALIACLVSLLVGCFWVRGVRVPPAEDVSQAEDAAQAGPGVRTLVWGLAVTALLCGAMYVLARPGGVDEAPYLLTRLRLLEAGQRPYVDFEFLYGPMLLYVPLAIDRVMRCGPFVAYSLAWTMYWLVGTAMLWSSVRAMRFTTRYAGAAFWLMWSAFLSSMLNYGATYTPMRQGGALFCMMVAHGLLVRRTRWSVAAFSLVATAVLFSISMEIGLAFQGALALYLVVTALSDGSWRQVRVWLPLGLQVVGAVAMYRGIAALHMLDSAKEFGGGSADVPMLLTPTTLMVLVALFAGGVMVIQRLRARQMVDARVAVMLVTFALLPGAFGRADPSHVVLYGLGALMVMLWWAARVPRMWRVTAITYVVVCSGFLLVAKVYINRLVFLNAALQTLYVNGEPRNALGAAAMRHMQPAMREKLMLRTRVGPLDAHEVYAGASAELQAPFGYVVPGAPGLGPHVWLGYYDGDNDVMDPRQVHRRVMEIAAHGERDLLVPLNFAGMEHCSPDAASARGLLRDNFGYNYLRHGGHTAFLKDELCAYVLEHYEQVAVPPNGAVTLYSLWRRKG